MLTHNNRPTALLDGDRRLRIVRIQDLWCLDDEWWRQTLARRYYQVVLETGAMTTIYHDLTDDTWYAQRY